MAEHYLDDSVNHPFWDRDLEPRVAIEPGDVVTFECPEPCGQVTPDWTDEDLERFDPGRVHALIGPVYVKGARPGDSLEVEVLGFEHRGWGWSAHMRGFGLLAEEFDYNYIHHWRLGDGRCEFGVGGIEVPLAPFCGCMGVAPAEAGRLKTMPPRRNGGNVDVRDLVAGSTVWLPVLVEGALFSCGDCHAAQGHGEVGGTGIESPMRVRLRIGLRRGRSVPELQYRTPGRVEPAGPRQVTTACGPDLLENSRQALRYLLDWLEAERGLTRSQALVLASAAADLTICEVVDRPNWLVSASIELRIFGSAGGSAGSRGG